jgi:type II secretory pathway pseudopilin PulG
MRSRIERRRRAQAGTTLIELLVSVMIIGLVVVVLVGSFSTGLLDATLVKRNTAVTAAQELELEKIEASVFSSSPSAYSECFATDTAAQPTQVALGGACPAGSSVRADVTESDVSTGVQRWAIQVVAYPSLSAVGTTLSVYKVSR